LTGADEAFVRQFRTGRNVLGAVQLCTLPWLGFVPDEVALAPDAAVGRLSQRLGIAMGELRGYGEREQTRTDHLREVAGYAGWRSMDTAEWKDLEEFLFARAMEHDSPKLLFRLACEYLWGHRDPVVGRLHHALATGQQFDPKFPDDPARARSHPDRHPVNPRRERFASRWDDPDPQPPRQRPTNPVHRPPPRGDEIPSG
jgi:hypothetical protein